MEQSRIMVDMALKAWNQEINRADKFIDAQTDENLQKEVAPGKNRLSYLVGHLISSNESMMTLFGFGPKLYPTYVDIFSKNPDRALPQPSAAELRKAWKETHAALGQHFGKLSVNEWLDKHTSMTAEDLAKEPTRNKLSVLLSRTSHVAYHLGQMILTNSK
jgi:uncharacterized damage-inducible protein DinB